MVYQARLLRNIGEGAVAVVLVETIGGGATGEGRLKAGTIYEK